MDREKQMNYFVGISSKYSDYLPQDVKCLYNWMFSEVGHKTVTSRIYSGMNNYHMGVL